MSLVLNLDMMHEEFICGEEGGSRWSASVLPLPWLGRIFFKYSKTPLH